MKDRSLDGCFADLKRLQLETPPQPPGDCIVTAIGSARGGTGVTTLTAYLGRHTALGLENSHVLEKEALLGRIETDPGGFFARVRVNQGRVHSRNNVEPKVDRRKVLVIVSESGTPMANCLGLGLRHHRTLLSVALGECGIDDCIVRDHEFLHVLPASGRLDELERHLCRQEVSPFRSSLEELSRLASSLPTGERMAAQISGLTKGAEVKSSSAVTWLRDALVPLRDKYSRIYIDMPRTCTRLAQSALVAADNVLCVVGASDHCFVDAEQFLDAVDQAHRLNPHLYIVGIIVNRMKQERPRLEYGLKGIRSRFGALVMPFVEDHPRIAEIGGVSVRDSHIKRQMSALLGELYAREEAR